MLHRFTVKRAFALLLAVVMAAMPLSPVFAVVAGSGEAHAVPASHDNDRQADGPAQADYHSTKCTQHASSAGHDRDCCAHCFGVLSLLQVTYLHSHPVQTPVLNELHPFSPIASRDRPPRFLSF